MASVLQDRLDEVEGRIMGAPVEFGYAFSPEGNLVLDKEGDPYMIPILEEERPLLRGAVFTHNHPVAAVRVGEDDSNYYWQVPQRGLSLEDIYFACRHSLAEIRVVDPEYVYTLIPAPGQETFSPEAIESVHAAWHFAYEHFGPAWEELADSSGFDLDMAIESSLYYPFRITLLAAALAGMSYDVQPVGSQLLPEALRVSDSELFEEFLSTIE